MGTGGTEMWCPECETIRTCKAIPAAQITFDHADYNQRWQRRDHPDINWFQRGRLCLHCDTQWLTAEVDHERLAELVHLRDALADLKLHAERYAAESSAAASSLEALQESLGVLRALQIYKKS